MYKCSHGQLDEEDCDKPWLDKKEHSSTLKALADVVLDKKFLSKASYYINFRSIADLERFHQHLLMYCSKRFAYTPPVYRMRNLIAAIDHNEHVDRETQLNNDGSTRLK